MAMTPLKMKPSKPKLGYPNQEYMYPPVVGATIPMIDCVAMLRPRAVPVAESGTHFVMVLLVMVFRRVVAIIMGIRVRARRTMWLARVCVCMKDRRERGNND